ncbi:MAG TPA: hypothetical protein VLF90_00135 [Patescibacteria group bacterium]|nr:hypothetical protein [Patescibacteria group bacterium]
MSAPNFLSDEHTEFVRATNQKSGPLVAIRNASRLAIPGYQEGPPSTAREAMEQKTGNCFAHTEVNAIIASQLPEVIPLITLRRGLFKYTDRRLHAECVIIAGNDGLLFVGNTYQPRERRKKLFAEGMPEVLIEQSLTEPFIEKSLVAHGVATIGREVVGSTSLVWTADLGSSADEALIDLTGDEHSERLVMTIDIGIPTLHTISLAHRFKRLGEQNAYSELLENNQALLSHFGPEPIEVPSGN